MSLADRVADGVIADLKSVKLTGGAIVRRALEDEGIDLTFGIPGTHNIELYDALAVFGVTFGALSNFTTWINKASHARW